MTVSVWSGHIESVPLGPIHVALEIENEFSSSVAVSASPFTPISAYSWSSMIVGIYLIGVIIGPSIRLTPSAGLFQIPGQCITVMLNCDKKCRILITALLIELCI